MKAGLREQIPLVVAGFVLLTMIEPAVARAQDQSTPSTPTDTSAQNAPVRVRVSSRVEGGLLIKKVSPKYPKKARNNYIQGTVILTATISEQGDVVDLKLVSGDPLLVKAAVDAVKQWKYKPYLLQGQPVVVETQVQVNFVLTSS